MQATLMVAMDKNLEVQHENYQLKGPEMKLVGLSEKKRDKSQLIT